MRRTALNGQWSLDRSDSGWANGRAFAAISDDGQVQAWGDAASGGQLPDALSRLLTRQPDVPWIWTVELASSTAAFAARRANGQVVAWGDPSAGGAIPQELREALSSDVVRLFGLGRSFVALKVDGSVIHWGNSGSGISEPSGLDLSQPYQVVTSFDSLAILQNGRVVGCWGGVAGAQQWAERSDLRSALASDVLELVCNDAGFAARTSGGEVITWGLPQGIGDASGVSITSRPDIVGLGSDAEGFHGFTARGQIRLWSGQNSQYQAGDRLLDEPTRQGEPISDAVRFFRVPGGGIGWVDDIGVLQLYEFQPSVKEQFIPDVDITINQNPFLGPNGLAVIDQGGDLQTFGYRLDQTNKPDLGSPNPNGPFSPSSKDSSASWQTVRANGGAFAALANNGQIGLWGDAGKGASPVNPQLMQQLLTQSPATSIYSNAGAFVAISGNGTAISWGDGASDGAPLIFSGIHHLVSPWENVRIDELGPGLLSLITNGQPNPQGQNLPLRVREGDQLSAVISGDPNGDRADTTGNLYRWSRNDQPAGAATETQASINLDALSEGTWSVTPTYLDLPGFSRTLAPLSVQVEKIDNGQSRILIQPYTFNGPANQAFSAGNGKVAELVASLSGDPEGIRSIDQVQWYRDGVAITSYGTPQNSILLATEPGDYSFEATTTDNQGYTTTQRSGLVRIDPAGSVPSQSHLALGGLQTLWRLNTDGPAALQGRTVERFDSTSLRMRPVDMGSTAGYLAISASSDGNAWALASDGVVCVYDTLSNRFLRLDGAKLDDTRPDSTLPDLGGGWRQIVAARGSNTAPALWLLGDFPENGGSNVAYLKSRPAAGQTLADLKPVVLEAGPALRLLAVGDDQTPWGIDRAGDLWTWDPASGAFSRLAAGVGTHIRQLQMVDKAQVWGLDEQGVLQMWNSETNQFTPVPLNSPFWTRRSQLISPEVTPTWESFSLSPMGGFVGIPRSGVNLPAGGNGLVAFDTSEISRLRNPNETISQLQLLGGETVQDNGVRQLGQNLAFNLNDQVNVAYTLNGSRPGQWEGAAVVPGAQSGADLQLVPGPSRDAQGSRLPVIQLNWNSSAKADAIPYQSEGYVSPFGGLVFSQAKRKTMSELAALSPLKAQITDASQAIATSSSAAMMRAPGSSFSRIALPGGALGSPGTEDTAKNSSKLSGFGGLGGGFTKGGSITGGGSWEKRVGKNWKLVINIGVTFSNDSKFDQSKDFQKMPESNLKVDLESDVKWIYNAPLGSWGNNGNKFKRNRDDSPARRQLNAFQASATSDYLDKYNEMLDSAPGLWDEIDYDIYNPGIYNDSVLTKITKGQTFSAAKFGISISGQLSGGYDFSDRSWTWSAGVGAEANLSYPLWTPFGGYVQFNADVALGVDYSYQHSSESGQSDATQAPVRILAPDGTPATSQTPVRDIGVYVDIDSEFSPENNGIINFLTNYVTPASDIFVGYINPLIQILNGNFLGAASGLSSDLLAAAPDLNPMQAEQLADLESDNLPLITSSSAPDSPSSSQSEFNGNVKLGASIILDAPFILATISPALKFGIGTKGFSVEALVKAQLIAAAGWLTWSEELKWSLLPGSQKQPSSASSTEPAPNSDSAAVTNDQAGARYIVNSGDRIKAQPFDALDASDLKILSGNPEASLTNAVFLATHLDGDRAVGLYRLDAPNPNQPWLFELGFVDGTRSSQQPGGIRWDWSTAKTIEGSLGLTTNVQLIRLSDGRLAVAGSHIAAADPLLAPISQLPPGTLYRIRPDQVTPGGTTVLDGSIAQKSLPSDRIWAQLGSGLASSSSLRSDWIGDSLIAGAGGSNDGAGALYIINGLAVSQLDDLSILENNRHAAQGGLGLVILGSHQSGSHSGLGQKVINGGDTNGDGFNEIFAAAPDDEAGAGKVYMLYGGKALQELPRIAPGSITLDTLDDLQASWRRNLYLQSFSGLSGTKAYGTILAGGVDLNGDGHADPLIGDAATTTTAGSVELWSSRQQLEQAAFQPGVLDGDVQAIPHFDRSLLVGSRSAQAEQSAFRIHAASSVGDLDGDGHGEIVLSSDSQAALMFGDGLMPVYWEASSLINSAASNGAAAPFSQTWTASWRDGGGQRFVLSFAGADRNGDGQIRSDSQAGQPPEIDWIALRRDGDPANAQAPLVALSTGLADRWNGALQINASSLNFDLAAKTFSGPISLSASDANGTNPFSWSSAATGLNPDQAARSLRSRLITSPAPGVINAAGVGDFNGDGKADLALSQAGYRVLAEQGKDLVVRPGVTAMVYCGANWTDTSGMALELDTIGTTHEGVRLDFGGELTAIGDWNHDARADLLIRDPYANNQAGGHVLLHGREGASPLVLQLAQELSASRAELLNGSAANSLTGASAAAGDFSGNGGRTLMLGAPNTVSKQDLLKASTAARVLTAFQNGDGSWQAPQQLPDFAGAGSGVQQLSSYTAVGTRILATWVNSSGAGSADQRDELWAAFLDPSSGQWSAAHKLQSIPRGDLTVPAIGPVEAVALSTIARTDDGQSVLEPSGGVLLAWTSVDAVTGRTFLFQSTYDPAVANENLRWSAPAQQDPQALLLANQDAISGSQLKLQFNPGSPEQRSQIWAEASISSEDQDLATIYLRRSGDLSQPLSLTYSTRDRSAAAGSQYVHSSGDVHFEAGAASASVAIPLIDNDQLENRNTEFVVDFQPQAAQRTTTQLLLGSTPIASESGLPVLSVSTTIRDNDGIRMRAIDAGISLSSPVTLTTGTAATASTVLNPGPPGQSAESGPEPTHTIALVGDPGANEGLGQVYALFVAATESSAANPGMDWKQLNAVEVLDRASRAQQGDGYQLNVLIQPEAALAALDPRAGFGTAMVKLRLNGGTAFAISAPGNPLDGGKPGRVYVVSAKAIEDWTNTHPDAPLILNEKNSLIIEQIQGGLFGSVLTAADLNEDGDDELVIGAPGLSEVSVISGANLKAKSTGRISPAGLSAQLIRDSSSNPDNGNSAFGGAIEALDLDGDGNLDLAIGAPGAGPVRFKGSGFVVANAGAVHVLQGNNSLEAFSGDVQTSPTVLHFSGYSTVNARGSAEGPPRPISEGLPPPGSFGFGESLGTALAAVDLNSDGIKDLAIGAPLYTPDGVRRTGRVVTWFGGATTASWGQAITLGSSLPAGQGISLVGQQDGALVGASLTAAGDLQSDRHDDLAIGAPMEDSQAGRVYVAFGSANRYGPEALQVTGTRFELDVTNPDSPFQTFEAPYGYQLGQTVVGLGDVNNDRSTGIGGDDLFLGSPTALFAREQRQTNGDISLEPAGQTHMAWGRPWLGPNQSLDVPFSQGVGYLLPFGGVPQALGDLNGDGYGDYALLGSSEDQGGATAPEDAGKLRIRFGAAVEVEQQQLLLSRFELKPAGTPLADDAVPLVVAGDFDGDAYGDLVALTQQGLRLLHGSPNLSLQRDAQTRWASEGTLLNISGSNDPISQLASGDFDGDGYDDVVMVNQSQTPQSQAKPTLSLFWGSATGLTPGGQKQLTSTGPANPAIDGLIALDSNGDGVDELAVYGDTLGPWFDINAQQGWSLQLLAPDRNSPADPFTRAVQSSYLQTGLNGVPTALSSGDLNGDGCADLLIDHGGNRIDLLSGDRRTFLNVSDTGFSRKQAPQANIQRSQLARFIGDVNADGHDDLLFSPTSPSPLRRGQQPGDVSVPQKYGAYSYVYLGTSTPSVSLEIPSFWDESQDSGLSTPERLKAWAPHGYTIESLPGEASPYRTGSIGDVNGDGFAELLFSSNQLYVNGTAEQRPHSIAIYGAGRLTPAALKTTTSNDGTYYDDTLHQLGSAGKQELLMRGRAGSDLLQVHADPYGATLSIPSNGDNAGRLTISASNDSTLWSQPRNPYELVLRDGQLQIIKTSVDKDKDIVVKAWGGGNRAIDRVYLAANGWLYFLKAGINDNQFRLPNASSDLMSSARDRLDTNKGILGMAGWFENDFTTFFEVPTTVGDSQLVFNPANGALYLVNRQSKEKNGDSDRDNWAFNGLSGYYDDLSITGPTSNLDGGKTRRAAITLFEGDPNAPQDRMDVATLLLKPGESLFDEAGARVLQTNDSVASLNALQISRRDLMTFVGNPDAKTLPFGIRRTSPAQHDRSLADIFNGTSMASAREDIAWAAPPVQQDGPYVVAMDGNGRLTINAQNKDGDQIKPGSELAVLHPGNPDPFLPPIGSEPVLLRPGFSSDQITQGSSGSRSTNNNFLAVLKGGLDDDRLGVDALQRIGAIDGGPGVDTLFFSSLRSDGNESGLNLVGLGSRISNIEVIEIPINNTLNIDEAILLNTPLHRLKLESRGNASVSFLVREKYVFIGDQIDAGQAYSVWSRPGSNLQLWVQQGRVTLHQMVNANGSSASVTSRLDAGQARLTAADPIDADQLAIDPAYAFRWYRDDLLIAGATEASYSEASGQGLQPGIYRRETDYTDRIGLRQTVSSAPLLVDAAQAVAGGTLQALRTELDGDQRQRLENRQPGLIPDAEVIQLLLTPGASAAASSAQRIGIRSSSPGGSGLIALLNPDQAWPESVSGAGAYDFNGDGSLDTLTWEPMGGSGSGAVELQAALLRSSRADLAVLSNGMLGFVLQEPSGSSTSSVDAPALQSLRVTVLAAPAKVSAVLAIALEEGQSVADLSNTQRRQRAISLLSHQDDDPAILASGADRVRQLWLRADQQLVLLELPGKTLSDWDGSLVSEPLKPAQPMPQSGIAGARLQLASDSGLCIELEAMSTPQDLNSYLARSQTQAPLLDFRGLDGLSLQANLEMAREADFDTTMGFYAIDGLDGSIRDPLSGILVTPGDPNYGALAAANRIQALDGLASEDGSSSRLEISLSESRLLAPYAVVDDPELGTRTYYAFAAANPDGISHFRSFGGNVIGLEDQRGGGDLDYDDNMIHLELGALQG